MNENNKKTIKKIAGFVLKKMGISADIDVLDSDENKNDLVCNIKINEDASLIIGQNGENLNDLQHIIRLLVRKNSEEMVHFVIDVNSYRKERNDSIVWLAKDKAEEAIRKKRAVVLRPMSAYERRVVHMALAENDKVQTESVGEGEERKIVIKPLSYSI